jgi:hypothetical protein
MLSISNKLDVRDRVAGFAAIITILFAGLGCSLLSTAGDAEVIFAPTEVGTPEGEKVSNDIGPAGGTLASADGRLTLTVPKNAVTETTAFSIQPITNKAETGVGLAYRLEPDGMIFTTPLEISVRYDEEDLEGTLPEALFLAYQDQSGAWHAPTAARLDQAARTLTISTTHFTDFTVATRIQVRPRQRTLYVGESQYVVVARCKRQTRWDVLWSKPQECSSAIATGVTWSMRGPGSIAESAPGVIYTAPPQKPSPNIAWVVAKFDEVTKEWSEGPLGLEGWTGNKLLAAKMIIVNRAYKASGQDGPTVYSGTICDLSQPFLVTGTHPLFTFPFRFTPASPTQGKMNYESRWALTKAKGVAPYTVEGADTDSPRIIMDAQSTLLTPVVTTGGGGKATIQLTLLKSGEGCE